MERLNELSATELRVLIAGGAVNSGQVVDACLDRIRNRDATVGAWAFLDEDRARSAARDSDAKGKPGVLRGIPIGIKDNFDTFDMPTAYGSDIYAGHTPPSDASCVALLREAGAVILGKTVTSEFAAYAWGKTVNPLDPSRTAGISSMGSAAAVADHMVPVAIGSQTSGSIIRPAAFCGVVGYKATLGRFNRSGIKPLAESLDTPGIFARTVDDVALVAHVLGGDDADVAPLRPEVPRIGVLRPAYWDAVSAPAAQAFAAACRVLQEHGATTLAIEASRETAELADAHALILQYESARAFAFEYSRRRKQLSDLFRTMIAAGRAIRRDDYDRARDRTRTIASRFDGFFSEVDLIVTLAAESEARPAGDPIGHVRFNRFWTLLGHPCMTVPLHAEGRLPFAMLLVAKNGGDDLLFKYGRWIHDTIGLGRRP